MVVKVTGLEGGERERERGRRLCKIDYTMSKPYFSSMLKGTEKPYQIIEMVCMSVHRTQGVHE